MIKPRLRRVYVSFLPHIKMLWWQCEGGGICVQLDTPEGAYALWKHRINPPHKGLTEMAGITKDDLMQMARDSGLLFNEDTGSEVAHARHVDRLRGFTNAILERAAVECDENAESHANSATKTEEGGDDAHSVWAMATATKYAGAKIRALKIPEGE